jgi:subtilisin-like proprotein convertase family protein
MDNRKGSQWFGIWSWTTTRLFGREVFMKRWIAVFMLVVPFLLVACGGDGGRETPVYTYYSIDTPLPIPDEDSISSEILVTGAPPFLSKVTVTVAILHTDVIDLDMILVSPDGWSIYLYEGESSGQDFWYTTFDDDALEWIGDTDSGDDPRTGYFKPTGFLDDFYGENPNGVWTLDVFDILAGDDGYLVEWSIDIQ